MKTPEGRLSPGAGFQRFVQSCGGEEQGKSLVLHSQRKFLIQGSLILSPRNTSQQVVTRLPKEVTQSNPSGQSTNKEFTSFHHGWIMISTSDDFRGCQSVRVIHEGKDPEVQGQRAGECKWGCKTQNNSALCYFIDTTVALSPLHILKSNSSLHMYKVLKKRLRRQEKIRLTTSLWKLKYSACCAL